MLRCFRLQQKPVVKERRSLQTKSSLCFLIANAICLLQHFSVVCDSEGGCLRNLIREKNPGKDDLISNIKPILLLTAKARYVCIDICIAFCVVLLYVHELVVECIESPDNFFDNPLVYHRSVFTGFD